MNIKKAVLFLFLRKLVCFVDKEGDNLLLAMDLVYVLVLLSKLNACISLLLGVNSLFGQLTNFKAANMMQVGTLVVLIVRHYMQRI